MIDWNKPIEQIDHPERKVFVNEVYTGGTALVTYEDEVSLGYVTRVFTASGTEHGLRPEIAVRNKPKFIKPEGWVSVYYDGTIEFHTEYDDATKYNPHSVITLEEFCKYIHCDGGLTLEPNHA